MFNVQCKTVELGQRKTIHIDILVCSFHLLQSPIFIAGRGFGNCIKCCTAPCYITHSNSLNFTTLHFNRTCILLNWNSPHYCIAIPLTSLRRTAHHLAEVHCIARYHAELWYTALHFTLMQCSALHFTSPKLPALNLTMMNVTAIDLALLCTLQQSEVWSTYIDWRPGN